MTRSIYVAIICIATALVVIAQLPADDCSWTAPASASPRGRTPVKIRTAKEAAGYTNYNNGKAISIADCSNTLAV